ncbi:hypothetical protein IFR05_016169 [Cadophora sp. M221]|nr:hypothetical protein IFR05_016169 [Cadophora sp. M221]
MKAIKSTNTGREVRCGIRKTVLDDIALPSDVGMIEIHFSSNLDKLKRLHVDGGLYEQNALYQLAVCTRPWGWAVSHFPQIILGPKMHYILGSSTASCRIAKIVRRYFLEVLRSANRSQGPTLGGRSWPGQRPGLKDAAAAVVADRACLLPALALADDEVVGTDDSVVWETGGVDRGQVYMVVVDKQSGTGFVQVTKEGYIGPYVTVGPGETGYETVKIGQGQHCMVYHSCAVFYIIRA